MPTILQLTPFVLCSSLQKQIDFYCDRLDFLAGFGRTITLFCHWGRWPFGCWNARHAMTVARWEKSSRFT